VNVASELRSGGRVARLANPGSESRGYGGANRECSLGLR
jgi:hypothetical protein